MKFKIKVVFIESPGYTYTYNGFGNTYSIPLNRNTLSSSYQLLNEKDEILGTFYSREAAKEAAKYYASKNNNVEEFTCK